MSLEILSHGCRLNTLDGEGARRAALAAGVADAVVINSCAVTAEAVRQAGQAVRRARRERPGARIVVTGCAAQIEPARFRAMPEVDAVLGNREKLDPAAWMRLRAGGGGGVGDILAPAPEAAAPAHAAEGRTRAFVQVQTGCDHRCTFCVIPYGRGRSRSVPPAAVIGGVRRLVDEGRLEVVLTGVDITAYGADLEGAPTLGTLVQAILEEVPDLPRLRLSSIDSVEADPALLDAIAGEERLMPHLHLSLQAGDDLVLKRMKRRHGRSDALRFCDRVRRLRPGVALGADIIAGFPTETEDQFRRSLRLVEECGLAQVHVFPYSARPHTPAARMPQVDRGVVRERAARLREAGRAAWVRHLDGEVGRVHRVLVEKGGFGRTEAFTPVRVPERAPSGTIVALRADRHDGAMLIAEAA